MFAKASTSGAATVNSNDGNAGTGFKPVKGRRGTLYHLSSTVGKQQNGNATLDDVKISRRFAANRYFFSAAGILKLLIIVSTVPLYLYRVVIHAVMSQVCFNR